jgi:hypothetical protein
MSRHIGLVLRTNAFTFWVGHGQKSSAVAGDRTQDGYLGCRKLYQKPTTAYNTCTHVTFCGLYEVPFVLHRMLVLQWVTALRLKTAEYSGHYCTPVIVRVGNFRSSSVRGGSCHAPRETAMCGEMPGDHHVSRVGCE